MALLRDARRRIADSGLRIAGLRIADSGLRTPDCGADNGNSEVAGGESPSAAAALSPQLPAPSPRAISSGTVNHATCDRIPVASPAPKAAIANDRGPSAHSVTACSATAAARPAMSLSGRTALNQ